MSKYFILFILGLFLTLGCDDEPKSLTQAERSKINRMYNDEIKFLRKEADSLCKVYYDEWFQKAVDSIRMERMEEIELLMKDKQSND